MERAEAQVGEAGTMKRDNTDAAGRGSHHRMLMRGLAAFGAEDSVRAVAHCCQRNGLIINYTLSRARDVPVYAPKIQLEEPGQLSHQNPHRNAVLSFNRAVDYRKLGDENRFNSSIYLSISRGLFDVDGEYYANCV